MYTQGVFIIVELYPILGIARAVRSSLRALFDRHCERSEATNFRNDERACTRSVIAGTIRSSLHAPRSNPLREEQNMGCLLRLARSTASLLAMTRVVVARTHLSPFMASEVPDRSSLRAQRSNPLREEQNMGCFVAPLLAMTNVDLAMTNASLRKAE
jgi:hypothetical protein